ncbi:hypothetical protein LZ30DRAFT_20576 [Colletotrichum cereale]|nr:hypothetical protein LZ30DRAFT_20576 [Colletotrichum cereale]
MLSVRTVSIEFSSRNIIHLYTGPQGRETGHALQFRPLHIFLGDGLLGPGSLVRGAVITPIPAENLAVLEWPDISPSRAAGGDSGTLECWPVFTGLGPGGWVLVVSHEWYVGPKTLNRNANLSRRRIPTDAAFGVPVVRYAFLRAKQPVTWPDTGARDLHSVVGRNAVEVVGDLKSFLRKTGRSDGDLDWVDALVLYTASSIQETWNLEQLPPELESIMPMDDDMARSIFSDFLEDAAYIRGNVRTAMQGLSDSESQTLLSDHVARARCVLLTNTFYKIEHGTPVSPTSRGPPK